MKNKIIAVFVVVSVLIATTLTARPHEKCTHVCMHTRSIVHVMTSSTAAQTVHSYSPNNHNLQEMVVSLVKTQDFANSADYMEGLTAISKRCIYVGEAAEDCRSSVRINR